MKKTKLFKAAVLTLAAVMTTALLPGCGGGETAKEGSNETITLKYIMAGAGRQKDSQTVNDAFNEKLHEYLPNVNVEFDVVEMANYKQDFLLRQTGKEQIDIVNVYGLNFNEEISNGTFIPIDELLENHGQDVKAALPEWLWDYMKFDGELYGIPSYQMVGTLRCLLAPKEIAEKYLDIEGLKSELYTNGKLTDKAEQIIEDYVAKAAEAGVFTELGAASIWNELPLLGWEGIQGANNFHMNTKTHEIAYKFEVPEMKDSYKRHAEWYQKGWIRQDSLSYTEEGTSKGYAGGYILWDDVYDPWKAESVSKDGTEFITIPFEDHYTIPSSNAAAGTAITAMCEYPEEAMQVLNLMQTNKELYNLVVYGLEGTHYTKVSDDVIKRAEDAGTSSGSSYGTYTWIVGNTELAYQLDTHPDPVAYKKWVFEECNGTDVRSELIGFVLDTEPIADQVSQLEAIKSEYMRSLASGALGANWEAEYNSWIEKTKAAGLEEVRAEIKRQIDEFLASK